MHTFVRHWSFVLAITVSGQIAYSQSVPSSNAAQRSSKANIPEVVSGDLLQLYGKTKSANTDADMTAIARFCAELVPNVKRSATDRKYASSLLAWALNRRGEMRSELASELVAKGDLDRADDLDRLAAADFETAIKFGPDNWRTHHNMAIAQAMRGDYQAAIQEFTRAIELKSDYANAYFNRGEIYFELAEYSSAIHDYSRAIELSSTDPQYFNSRGHCKFMLQAHDDAIDDYRKAVELATDSAVYHTDLADAYQFVGQWEDSAKAYRAAVAVNNRYGRAYQNAAWLMATCPVEGLRNIELALEAAKRAIELDGKKTASALDTLAAATAANGKYNEAASIQREALQLAAVEQRQELQQRLALYESGTGFVQQRAVDAERRQPANSTSSRIRTASGTAPAPR